MTSNAVDPADEEMEATRLRGASALERALHYVTAEGNPLAVTRARILVELETVDRGVEALAALQLESGACSHLGQVFEGDLDSELRQWDLEGECLGTLEAISILSDWKMLHTSCAQRLIESLRSSQWSDGGWGSGLPDVADHPTRLFATGALAGFLGRSRSARPEMLTAAGSYLAQFWSVERIRNGGWPIVSAFALFYTTVFDEGGEAALPWCARELERGLGAGDYSAGMLLRTLFYCEAESLPGADFDTLRLLETLLDGQHGDGSFGREGDSAEGRVGPTLDAMMYILRLCRTGAPTTR